MTQVAILVVAAVIVFGIHKSDQGTQDRLDAQAHTNAVLTYNLCTARNLGVTQANARWARMARFILQAATIRAAQAQTDGSKLALLDVYYARRWQDYAAAIQPLPTAECGDAP